MIFKQLFDTKSSTYTYIIASAKGREAVIIDPVIENVGEYIKLLKELDLSSPKYNRNLLEKITVDGKINTEKLLQNSAVLEYIDVEESNTSMIAMNRKYLEKKSLCYCKIKSFLKTKHLTLGDYISCNCHENSDVSEKCSRCIGEGEIRTAGGNSIVQAKT